jgi:hypothetical protein
MRQGCILEDWAWAEWALSLYMRISLDEARRRLLAAGRRADNRIWQEARLAAIMGRSNV